MKEHHGRFYAPQQLAVVAARIAAFYSPTTAIDPCCEDVAILENCNFAKDRRAIFRNPSSLREAAERVTDIRLEHGDITRTSIDGLYDLVVSILPFGAKEAVNGRTERVDLIVAERCVDLLALNGVCLLVAPPNLLTTAIYHDFRNRVLDHMALDAVVEFQKLTVSPGICLPFAIVVIRNGPSRECGTFISEYESQAADQVFGALRDGVGDFFVSPERLRERWDRHYHDPQHQRTETELDLFETRRLEELGEIRRGRRELRSYLRDGGEFLLLRGASLRECGIVVSAKSSFVDRIDEGWFAESIVRPGDVLINLINPSAYVYKTSDPPAVLGFNLVLIRSKDNDYIATYLNTPDGKSQFEAQARHHVKGATISQLSVSDLRKIRIPILPIKNLNSVSDSAIAAASSPELETLRRQLESVKHRLMLAEAELERERQIRPAGQNQMMEMLTALERNQNFIIEQNAKILHQQQITVEKLGQIASVLTSILSDISDIKQGSRSKEEKLARICRKLDTFTEAAVAEVRGIQEFVEVVQTWLDQWPLLDALTQKFLPSAEQLYDLLEKQDGADFSPFIIQYCRALENEILKKVFCAYHDDVKARIDDIPAFLSIDLAKDERKEKKKTWRFADKVLRDATEYCLGDMNAIMQLVKPGGRTLKSSYLLQDFLTFTNNFFDQRIIENEFLEQVQKINEDFRRKAAHPYLMTKEMADKCLDAVRLALCEVLDSYKKAS